MGGECRPELQPFDWRRSVKRSAAAGLANGGPPLARLANALAPADATEVLTA